MDQDQNNRSSEDPDSPSSRKVLNEEQRHNLTRFRESERALRTLEHLKVQLTNSMHQMRSDMELPVASVPVPPQGLAITSLPTDSTSGVSGQESDMSVSVTYKAPTFPERSASSNNLIPGYDVRRKHQNPNQQAPLDGQRRRRSSEGEIQAELEYLRAKLDTLPIRKPTVSELQKELTENKLQSHQKICELNAEVMVKTKESECLEYHLARNHTELRQVKSEIANKEAENRKLRQQMNDMESKASHRILELTLELQQKSTKLLAYEKLYSDMDKACLDAVSSKEFSPDNIIGAIPLTAAGSIPVSFQFKLQQSMDLAQRLKDERDHLERCRDEADRKSKDIEIKYQGVLIEINKLKIGEDAKLTSAKASLQVKDFEMERLRLLLEDYKQQNKAVKAQIEELKKKIAQVNEQFNEMKCESSEEITRLSLELQSKSARLDLYEKIETSLDEMILKAGSIPDSAIGQNLLDFCTSGPPLPTDSRRRLQQAFDLAKRNCDLESTLKEKKEEILSLYDERENLRREVESVKLLNGYSVGQLVETITEKNREIGKLNKRIENLEQELGEIKQSNDALQQTVDGLKEYQNKLVTLYHSGAQLQLDSKSSVESTDGLQVQSDPKSTVYKKLSSTNLPIPVGGQLEGGTATAATSSIVSTEGQLGPLYYCGDSKPLSSTASTYTFPPSQARLKMEHVKDPSASSASSLSSYPSSQSRLWLKPSKLTPVSSTGSMFTFPPSESRLSAERSKRECDAVPINKLGPITEESDLVMLGTDTISPDSDSSITTDMLFPAANKIRVVSSYGVRIRKIHPYPSGNNAQVDPKSTPFCSSVSKSYNSRSSTSKTSTHSEYAIARQIPGRQVASADLILERSKKKEQPVALRLSKVKPSPSNLF